MKTKQTQRSSGKGTPVGAVKLATRKVPPLTRSQLRASSAWSPEMAGGRPRQENGAGKQTALRSTSEARASGTQNEPLHPKPAASLPPLARSKAEEKALKRLCGLTAEPPRSRIEGEPLTKLDECTEQSKRCSDKVAEVARRKESLRQRICQKENVVAYPLHQCQAVSRQHRSSHRPSLGRTFHFG